MLSSLSEHATLVDLLAFRASQPGQPPDHPVFTFLETGDGASETVTLASLDRRARSIAAHLRGSVRQGDRILLVYPPGPEFIAAFWGCIYAGAVAVPALPATNARTLPRLHAIVKDAQPSMALVSASVAGRMGRASRESAGPLRAISWLVTDDLPDASPHWQRPDLTRDHLAFLQYTSGSTGLPKGVMVSHGNIMANLEVLERAFGVKGGDTFVSWLPHYHDMGLIWGILSPLYTGCHCVQFPSSAFLARPYRWLKLISDYRARMTIAPNFAYELCIARVGDELKASLDLSSLEVAANGAEPIRADTLRRFSAAFAECGFRPQSFCPGYGLAEATLVVSVKNTCDDGKPATLKLSKIALAENRVELAPEGRDEAVLEAVSTGPVGAKHHALIVDPVSLAHRSEREVGEVWLSGPSIARGYWNHREETLRTFAAKSEGDDRPYLRTGDLGFLHQNELYIVGRLKEMMIFQGRNIYPQDVEAAVESVDSAFRAHGCAVFSLDEGGATQLVVLQELEFRAEPDWEGLANRIRAAIAEEFEIYDVAAIVLVKAGRIPRTTSGKIQRLQCKALFEERALEAVWEWLKQEPSQRGVSGVPRRQPGTETERALTLLWREVLQLQVAELSAGDNFFDLGGQSLLATLLLSRIRDVFQVEADMRALFEAPTLESLAARINALQRVSADVPLSHIQRSNRDRPLPLAYAQEGIWFSHQTGDKDNEASYHNAFSVRLAGELHVPALVQTFNEIVQRHEALRTRFVASDGTPFQIIAPQMPLEVPVLDWSGAAAEERRERTDCLIKEVVQTPFDLTSGPMLRASIVKLQPREHLLLLDMHHIASDGWSLGVLLREISALYTASVKGLACPLNELPVQYADYCQWQREWLDSGALRQQLEYWKGQLRATPALLELPTDYRRPRIQGFGGAQVPFTVSEDAVRALDASAREERATLFMAVVAVFATLLWRYSGQDDICIGTPVANRGRSETESLIGCFVNTLVLRTRLGTNARFLDLLGQVRATALEAFANQDAPFEQVVQAINPERHPSHSPLFQTMLVFQNAPLGNLDLPGLTAQLERPASRTCRFDLVLEVAVDDEGQLRGHFEYNTGLFIAGSIERMVEYFKQLLKSVVEAPETEVGELPMLPAAEREQVLYGWNRTEVEYPQNHIHIHIKDRCIHELFEKQAAARPGATAVVYEGASLSYEKLNQQANRLAHYLRGLGVKPDERVALCVERGKEMMVALLAVLKAGGAYVPLDSTYPQERLRFMLEDSAPVALLTQAHLRGLFAEQELTMPVIELEQEKHWENLQERNPDRMADFSARHPAYVIYTSGSSGAPKGVVVEHQSVVNLLNWTQSAYPLSADGAVLQNAPIGFDASVTGFFWPLVTGARVVMARPEGHKDAAYLCQAIRQNGVTAIGFPISMLPVFAEQMDSPECTTLAHVMCGGEALPGWVVRQFQERLPQVELHNLYGPTEATVASTAWTCCAWDERNNIPIGKPIANTRVYILDGAGEPVPVGVTGEIYIGGVGVARGYWNRADLTAERFVPNPYIEDGTAGARMYKTGDLGRWRADGNIEFLGRNDFQVKVRGFRVELGEIEARLREHAGVGEAVVVAREDEPGEKRLVAYYTASQADEEVSVEGLRAHLGANLPEYMVPTAWVQLDALPLTPNGKLDQKALPAPAVQSYSGRGYETPQGELESQIAQIWAEILKLDRVGRQDNFFKLGGHSLLAVRMMSRLRPVSGREVGIQQLFTHPVLGDFAKAVEGAARVEEEEIPRADRSGALPLSFAQQRLWFLTQLEGASRAYHIPGGLRLAGVLDRGALRRALNRIVERHEALRTTFQLVDGEPVQRIAGFEENNFALIEQDLRGRAHEDAERELERIVAGETSAEFDLERGPLIRGRLIRLQDEDEGGEERHALLLTMHHIVSDGWSMGVLGEELSVLYGAYREGKRDPLPELEIQYADYAVWQRRTMEGELLKRQAEYWKVALAGAPAMLELPTDRPRPRQQDYAGAMVEVVLDEALTSGLKELSRRHETTLYMTVLAGWAAVLSRLSGLGEVVIGTPTANRGHVQLEGLIGFFVNTMAVRVDLGGSPTGEELLGRVKERVVGAQANQEIPFDQVVEMVQPVRSTAHSPVFQVMLAWENTPPAALALPGLRATVLGGEGEAEREVGAKFDVTLGLREQGGKIVGRLTYAMALYERETMERHAGYLRKLLEGLVTDASAVVEEMPMLSEAEREQVLYGWNRTENEYPQSYIKDRCLHELFEEQVERTPQAGALTYEGGSLSYGELNREANWLAHYLRKLGVEPGERVALCVERGKEMMVGLLAVLKAGGAYVPLDPDYPVERLRFMLEDSAPVALLTQAHLRERLGGGERFQPVVDLSGDQGLWEQMPESNVSAAELGLTARHLAYVIYTSGSTGLPKGVMVEHRSICNYLRWAQDSYYRGIGNGSPAVHSVGFDGLLTTLFCPILAGETLTLLPSGGEIDALAEQSRKSGAPYTLLKLTPSHLRLLNQVMGEEGAAAPTQRLMIGGEPMVAADVALWQRRFPEVKLSNHFGPTETTVGSCSFEIIETITASTAVPIGKPIANTRIYILDRAGEPVPAGVTGELYIGGAGVARGYLNRPELTAERFVADPFAHEPGARMYKTGDLGRWRADGNIEFLGRNDFQVKIRGFRIELEEIEARLREHAGVGEAVVVAREDEPGDKRLVAYYTASEASTEVSVEELRTHLLTKLPEYMVPSGWVQLDALPLTPNGKLDRKALPAPAAQSYAGLGYEAPQGEVEGKIAQVWAEILKLGHVGRHDNFFELGGHSLLAVTLIERLRHSGLRTDLRTLFTMPTVAALAAAIESPNMAREVDVPANRIPAVCDAILPEMLPLVQLTEQDISRIVEHVPEGAGNVQDIYPLSPLQSGILFHHLAAGNGDPYLYALLLGFDSRARVDAYLGALEAVIRRHDILRTAVLWEKLPEPVQVVWRKAALVVEEVALDSVAGETGKELYARRQQRMDVRQAPMLRATIAADGESGRWVMLLQYHHLVSDHTTVEVVHQEMEAYLRGEMERLPAPLPFRNLVAQARLGKSEAEHESFFRQMLGDVEEPTAPFGLLRVRGDGRGTGEARLELEPELNRRMREQARRLGVSGASVFHLAWGHVLARLTGRQDVVFGTVLLGRMQGGAGSDRALGMFINTLPVRISVGQGAEESVRQTHALLGRLIEHEHAPLALAQRCSRVVAPLPLFTTMLNYRHSARSVTTAAWEGVEVLLVEERTNYPLTLSVDDLADGFRLTVLVGESLEAARICGYMAKALNGIVMALESAPQTAVYRIDVLPEQERHQLLQEWNATAAEYKREKCIHELFEEQVALRLGAVAVVFEGVELTYRELNCRANQLAHYLRDMGVGAEVRVGISMERSVEAVIGLLGVWKAGGVYVPLDPGYPAERLSYMLEDAQVPVLLTQEHLMERLPVSWTQVVSVDSRWDEIAEHSEENVEIELDPQNAAYVIYTSGSTGQPKGVVVEHRELCNMVTAQIRGFGVEIESRILQFASFSFDASIWEFMMALCRGAVLHMPGPGAVLMEETLVGMLANHGITHVTLPPAVLAILEEEDGLGSVRTLIVAGDTLTEGLAEKWVHDRELINAYGPTEATVCATMYRCENGTGMPPIGQSVANTRVYILDLYGELAPVGVTGEIYIGGAGVARGYLNRPELTAERFVADPFALDAGARMYKTGDLGRWRTDGNIEFVGRNDFQVKIRGFRIELGEIEARLREHAGVGEAVVMAREDEPGDKRLVAYYTASRASAEVSVEELRAHLGATLPEYMVPTEWVQLDALPLTPNGKLDRKALPAPAARCDAGRGYEAPQGELENQVAQIWAEILKFDRVGRHDNFFELGGHSLLVVRLTSRLQEAFDVDVPINEVFARPVLSSLSEYVLDKQLELYDPACLSEALQYMDSSQAGNKEGRGGGSVLKN